MLIAAISSTTEEKELGQPAGWPDCPLLAPEGIYHTTWNTEGSQTRRLVNAVASGRTTAGGVAPVYRTLRR